jgi:hypothetical protein
MLTVGFGRLQQIDKTSRIDRLLAGEGDGEGHHADGDCCLKFVEAGKLANASQTHLPASRLVEPET